MIDRLKLKNFQSHKNTEIEFDDGVNVIIGESDTGKSAVLRALNWVINNKPSGDAFRSSWATGTQVSIQADQNTITRTKNKKINGYETIVDGNITEFKAMGQNVPEQVQDLINIDPVNSQYQLDAPFLLSKSPGDVARHFNEMANLDIIDISSKNIKSKIDSTNRQVKEADARIEVFEEKLKEFETLDIIEAKINRLQLLETTHNTIKQKYTIVYKVIEDVTVIAEKQQEYQCIVCFESKVNTILDLQQDKSNLQEQKNNIQENIKLFEIRQDKEKSLKQIIKQEIKMNKLNDYLIGRKTIRKDKIELDCYLDDLDECKHTKDSVNQTIKYQKQVNVGLDLLEKTTQAQGQFDKLEDIVQDLKVLLENNQQYANKHKDLKQQYEELKPDECPLCGNSF